MKNGYLRLWSFIILIVSILLVNSFIENILNGYYMVFFLGFIIIIFKYMFGIEKNRHRFTKDIIFDILIFLLIFFLLFYLSGLFFGFVKTENYYSWYGFRNFLLPIIMTIILKELLRYYMLCKGEGNYLIIISLVLLFILLDITNIIPYVNTSNNYNIFLFIALTLLPTVTNNLCATYISNKVGYVPNMIWLIIWNMYSYLLPFVPDTGDYLLAIINFLLPVCLWYMGYNFFVKVNDKEILRNYNKESRVSLVFTSLLILTLLYFTSGKFHYHALAVASGSMAPNINKGDIVIIEKINDNYDLLKVGQVIAYKYDGVIIVHRLIDILSDKKEKFYYTKGDANKEIDNYAIKEDMIVGIVNVKIPYIGYPTVWLNQL